jgi:DNA-binding MarR family transcriptional regulator
MSGPRWLTDEQQWAWRRLVAVLLKLPVELDRQLQRDADMSHFEYWVVAMLSEAPGRRLQLKELAEQINSSPSRLSHVMRRLEERGWVVREPNVDDARASDAVLTDEGWTTVVATAPGHVEAVQQLVFDGLSGTDVEDLARVCERVLGQLESRPEG